MRFGAEQWLWLLWAAPLAAAVAAWALSARRAAARRFVSAGLLSRLAAGASTARAALKHGLLVLAVTFAALALARPQWGENQQDVRAKGRDVCFLVDVSRSMLAEDMAPSRLERAKLWIRDALAVAKGDRVALVAFAGEAVVKSPLTLDYGFFLMQLQDLSPASVTRGGTNIGDAIRLALSEVFTDKDARFKDIILITDGEDHESFPVQAAEAAGQRGVRIIAIGIGDEGAGKPIPITDASGNKVELTYNGERVLSRLDGELLKQIALASAGGKYLNVATGTIEMDSVYRKLVQEAEQRETRAAEATRHTERFQIFLAVAAALLAIEPLLRERRRPPA